MEGGQKAKISLESGLDVKSSDQLVPVSQPLFQHNRQRFQGHTLPTSLRFEHNGFGAGWGVYEFEINYLTVDTTPARFTVMRQQLNANPTYIFRLRIGTTTYAMVYWNGEDSVKAGDLEITRGEGEDFSTVTLKGDNDGHELELVIDMVSGDISYKDDEWFLIEGDYHTATAASGQTDISLLDLTSWVEFSAAIVFPEDVEYSGQRIASYYSCVSTGTGHVHTWNDPLIENGWTVEYNSDTNEAWVNGVQVDSGNVSFDSSTGIVDITHDTSYEGTVEINVTGEVFYFQIYGIGVSATQKHITTSASGSYAFEAWEGKIEGDTFLYPTTFGSGTAYVTGWLPYWVGFMVRQSNSSASSLSYTAVDVSSSTPISSYINIYQGGLIYASYVSGSRYFNFYNTDVQGMVGQYWEGGRNVTSSKAALVGTQAVYSDLVGSLTFCCCVFNRIRIRSGYDSYPYSPYPIAIGTSGDSSVLEENSNGARWVESFSALTMVRGSTTRSSFLAGYYVPMEENERAYALSAGGGYMSLKGFPWVLDATPDIGDYVWWEDYNEYLEDVADYWRANVYEDRAFFVAAAEGDTGAYVSKDEQDSRVAPYLQAEGWSAYDEADWPEIEDCLYFTVAEWNAAAERYNALQSSESDYVTLLGNDAGSYAINFVTEETSEYARDSLSAWVISSDYVGEYQSVAYSDEVVVGDETSAYYKHMRLEYPYAFYNVSVTAEGWPGTRFRKSTGSSSTVASFATSVMAVWLRLMNDVITDGEGTYYLGAGFNDGGVNYYLAPRYRTTVSSTDSRSMTGGSSSGGNSQRNYASIYGTAGALLGNVCLSVNTNSGGSGEGEDVQTVEYEYSSTAATGDSNVGGSFRTAYTNWLRENLLSLVEDIQTWINDGYVIQSYETNATIFPRAWTSEKPSEYLTGHLNINITYYKEGSDAEPDYSSVNISSGSSTSGNIASITASGGADVTSELSTVLTIPPLAAYLVAGGIGSEEDIDLDNGYAWLAVCFRGYYQYELTARSPSGEDPVFTVDNFASRLSFARSESALLHSSGIYIDRDSLSCDSTTSSYASVGSDHCIDLVCKSAEIGSSGAELKMFFRSALDEDTGEYRDYYVYYGQGSGDSFVPGDIYYGSSDSAGSGYNLRGQLMGTTYTTSALTFSITADAVEFYKANSLSVSWPNASATHEFYSGVLQDARPEMSVSGITFVTPSYSLVQGAVSGQELLDLEFNGTRLRAALSFSQADDEGTTTLELAEPTAPIEFEGYSFTFGLRSYQWDSNNAEILLDVSVPLSYPFQARVPYQFNYAYSLELSEDGKYIVDGDAENPLDSVPVGTVAVEFDPATLTYAFETDGEVTGEPYKYYYSQNTDTFTYGITEFSGTRVGDALAVTMEGYEYLEYSFILEGAYQTYKCTLISFDEDNIVVDYDDVYYTFPYAELMTDEEPDEVNFMYTDTRDSAEIPETRTFARQNFEDEYQFLRQAWDTTTEVENYWWVDSETILELNKENLVVKKKKAFEDFAEEATVDDWGGDFWEDVAAFPRYEYIDNTTPKYGMTCAYGGENGDVSPRFWTMAAPSSATLTIRFYELVETDWGSYTSYSLEPVSTSVTVRNVDIGDTLNSASVARINTYSQLSAETLLYGAKFSSTVIGDHILFGIHYDNNFNQWALDMLITGELQQVVQGYGFVGVNGCLTGGEIPSAWFDPTLGFTGAVQDVSVLEQEEDLEVSSSSEFIAIDCGDIVVGDESQQWYISKKLTSIVSHLVWDEEAAMWGTEVLYLNNNVDQVYGSASFGANVVSEKGITSYNFFSQLEEAFGTSWGSSILSLLKTIGTVYMLYLSPRLTTMLYLQQTMGQYAYVHYNSETPGKQPDLGRENTSSNGFSDEGIVGRGYSAGGTVAEETEPNLLDPATPESQDDFSFNLHTIRQQVYIDKGWSGLGFAAVYVLLQGLLSLTDTASSALQVNKHSNKMSASDFGRQFGQAFLKNMDKLSSVDTNTLGMMPVQNSALTGVLTLDMFYSTSEGQKVDAGPGWVQHNFVAQCVAQSVTSNQMELKQVGIFIPLSELGTLVYRIAQKTLYYISEALFVTAEVLASGGDQYGVMGTAASITAGVAAAAKFAIQLFIDIADVVDNLLRSFTGSSPLAKVLNTGSKHSYDMEGKHRYGQKSEVFMWPCFDIVKKNSYENESVKAVCENVPWSLSIPTGVDGEIGGGDPVTSGTVCGLDSSTVTYKVGSEVTLNFSGDVPYMIANCKGATEETECPEDMACAIGCESFLPPVPFRNENIGVSSPAFPTPPIQDYIIDKEWELGMTATQGYVTWVSCKDTKLIDGEYSNIVVDDEFCGVACPYTAIEVQRGYEQKYVRPWAITPNAIALNQTGLNAAYDEKAYHAFDGYGYRLVRWCGAPGMNKEGLAYHYAFLVNDRFKRSNKLPPNAYIGNFVGEPVVALRTLGDDKIYNASFQPGRNRGLSAGTVGEDRDSQRYAAPVFAELVSTLPSVLKTVSSYNLTVVDGITSLTSDNRDLQSAYKAPVSIDFAIGKDKYRFTDEYICSLEQREGITVVTELVPTLGLTYLGATPYEAYLYSAATRQYYTYSGGSTLNAVDMLERFRDIIHGRYDFVNQEVALPCVATFVRLDKHVLDDEDERDNTIVPRLKNGKFVGEISPPIETIYNMRSGFKTISLPSGLCFQGPNRCIINRFVYSDYMKDQIRYNAGQWERVPRETYHPFRKYEDEYAKVDENVLIQIVGWTHNPFLLVTSPLGVSSEVDCIFEWEITFAWPVEMDDLYDEKQYATVNIMAETFCPGGKVVPDRPAHVFLYKELFTRTGNYGYYSFRYQSRCGAGNRERLHIWSDQYIAVSGLQVEYKQVTQKRTEILTQQADVMDMAEF